MALIQVSYCLLDNELLFEALMNAFDEIAEVKDDPYYKRKVFRVQREEITKEDVVICPTFYHFEGVIPFIIEFE